MYVGVYGNIIDDLINIGKFRIYKKIVARMSNDQKYDIYFGVYLSFLKNRNKDDKVEPLFTDLLDWFRIDTSVKFMQNKLNN